MEFPPTGWEIFEAKLFESAAPRIAGDLVMDMMVQVRPNGRCLDHWRIGIGGSKILEADFRLTDICRSTRVSPFKLKFQSWPRDVKLRRNMTTSKWYDGMAMIAQREAAIYKQAEEQPSSVEDFLAVMEGEEDISKKAFAVRFGIGIAADKSLNLEMQGLPASEDTLTSKPAFIG
jgi:hypothetical protein